MKQIQRNAVLTEADMQDSSYWRFELLGATIFSCNFTGQSTLNSQAKKLMYLIMEIRLVDFEHKITVEPVWHSLPFSLTLLKLSSTFSNIFHLSHQ